MKQVDKTIDARFLKEGFKVATENLLAHKDEINALNVFPVPDGDTGHNMSACMLEATHSLEKLPIDSMTNVLEAIRTGTLMGARGNSGVILSQIFSGFCEAMAKKKEISMPDFCAGLEKADQVARGAVMKPVKGTILTLINDVALFARRNLAEYEGFPHFLRALTERSFLVVDRTREMMPKLKQAGVVDAGAKGLAYIFEGFFQHAMGKVAGKAAVQLEEPTEKPTFALEDLTYLYCTEFMLRLFPGVENGYIASLKQELSQMGDSVVIVHDGSILKGHIHTNHPGQVFEKALSLGELHRVKVDNMKEQHESLTHASSSPTSTPLPEPEKKAALLLEDEEHLQAEVESPPEPKTFGFVSVSPGEGISRIFSEMHVDEIVLGGQTMNPSTADLTRAVEKVNAKNVFLLPNNPNITLAAESAAKMFQDSPKDVRVIPTRSIQEGIAALISFVEMEDLASNLQSMQEAIQEIVSISVTHAVRDSEVEGHKITEGEYLFFANKELKAHGQELDEIVLDGLHKVDAGRYEILTAFYGDGVEEKQANALMERIEKEFPSLEVSLYFGDQPHYPYYLSLE
ncbi:MAG TPA: DAK2 domain-containing protein [Thermotogota bacterium]|nr:DAK2 domain-containing protein [Thermotogota bacterium]